MKSVRNHHGTASCAAFTGPFEPVPKQLFMLVAKNTLGHLPFCSRAAISVPGAPESSGATDSQPPVLKPGVEICWPLWVAVALLSTFQPPVPSLVRWWPDWASGPDRTAALAAAAVARAAAAAAAATKRPEIRRLRCRMIIYCLLGVPGRGVIDIS